MKTHISVTYPQDLRIAPVQAYTCLCDPFIRSTHHGGIGNSHLGWTQTSNLLSQIMSKYLRRSPVRLRSPFRTSRLSGRASCSVQIPNYKKILCKKSRPSCNHRSRSSSIFWRVLKTSCPSRPSTWRRGQIHPLVP